MKKLRIVLIVHNVRSAHNVGSLLRTADGLAIETVYMSGYTPYPKLPKDSRLPHVSLKATQLIQKTALGAEKTVAWKHCDDILGLLEKLKSDDYTIAALEQSDKSISLPDYISGKNMALVVGREVEGLEKEVLKAADVILEIPMLGQKESYNVANAAAMALYQLRYHA
jgi:23S rRNA (guanosine2251-2'-O)-methyltransferase